MYSETCLNRSCSKAETLLRKTDKFDPVYFLYAFFSRIFKAKNCKEDTAWDRYLFQCSDKKAPCLTWTRTKILGISEEKRIKLDISVNFLKKKCFFTFQNNNFFFISICSFERVQHFWFELCIFIPSCFLQPTNNCFCATESDIDLQTILHPLWIIGFSTVTYIKLWWSVKDLQENALKIKGHDKNFLKKQLFSLL